MDNTQRGILALLRAAVSQKAAALPEGFSPEAALPIIRAHQIAAIAYEGAVQCGIDRKTQAMKDLFSGCCKQLLHGRKQAELLTEVTDAFENNQIDYMPLKGSVLKKLYPQEEQRAMGDADILIRTEQSEKASETMRSLGFASLGESDHELIFRKNGCLFELHKKLIPSYHEDYYAYFRDGWQIAKQTENRHGYALSAEDGLLYLLAHFAKHYRSGGIGLRHMTDLWVYLCAKPELDEGYLMQQLQELKLDVFYQNVKKTLFSWFTDGPEDEVTALITETVFRSGVYGTEEKKELGENLRLQKNWKRSSSVRGNYFLFAVFLPLPHMQKKYPVLKKAPILLPVFWVIRIFSVLLFNRKNVKQFEKRMQVSPQDIEQYQQELNAVGLEFDF